jgi:hypothetical protein
LQETLLLNPPKLFFSFTKRKEKFDQKKRKETPRKKEESFP